MRTRIALVLISGAFLTAGARPVTAQTGCDGQNVLTAAEKAAGWVLLFDGTTMKGWHGYNGQKPVAWKVAGCALETAGTEGNYGSDTRADVASDQTFTNFELSIEWKATKGGNSGLIYGAVEDPKYKTAWATGPEYQFIDDVGFPQKLTEGQKAGANYDMHPPSADKPLKPVGEWNLSKVVVNGAHVEHWLNGKKVVEFERWSDDWTKRRDASKWKAYPDWGKAATGRIVLQDHGSAFAFRNIKLRPLP